MIQGILIGFSGENNQEVISELKGKIEDMRGYGVDKVQMDGKTYTKIVEDYAKCTKDDGGQYDTQ